MNLKQVVVFLALALVNLAVQVEAFGHGYIGGWVSPMMVPGMEDALMALTEGQGVLSECIGILGVMVVAGLLGVLGLVNLSVLGSIKKLTMHAKMA
jgi:hypothetical protein